MKMLRKKNNRLTAERGKKRIEPEQVIRQLANQGRLAAIGQKAVADSFRLGLPVTQLEGNDIVQLFPDGRRVILKTIARAV